MAIVIISRKSDLSAWVSALKNEHPGLDVRIYPDDKDREEIEFALVWKHPCGVFENYPNINCIASMGAGVDHILKDPDLPQEAAITRLVDDHLTLDMSEFVKALVMNHIRGISIYKAQEVKNSWIQHPYRRIQDVRIGIMGMGVLGSNTGITLKKSGFNINGWSQTAKTIDGIEVFAGQEALGNFLAQSDILICMLPLTAQTRNILNRDLFKQLPRNAFVINVARGEHLVDEDLIEMIDSGHLSGASLDVFRVEPLPPNHVFWMHPKVNVTPHVASITDPGSVVPQIIDNYIRLKNNQPLLNTVSRQKGY